MDDIRLETLFEQPGLPSFGLPEGLRRRYDGEIGFDGPINYANFVTSLDGVVALDEGVPPSAISGKSEADRFVMGLLRACAEAVVVGAGTLRAEPEHLWTPEHIFPALAEAYGVLRRRLGLDGIPMLVVLTRSGEVDPSLPALRRGAIIVTTEAGAGRLRGRLPAEASVADLPGPGLDPREVLSLLRARGFRRVLTEGGPSVLGSFLREGLVDELFLTLSPRIAGREAGSGARRLGLVEGQAFPPGALPGASLLSLKRHASHLFLRYRLGE